MSGIVLPVEILHRIVDFNQSDRNFLATCSLSARSLANRCQKHLFDSPTFTIDVDLTGLKPRCISRSHWPSIKQAKPCDGRGFGEPIDGVWKVFEDVVRGSSRLAAFVHNFALKLRPISSTFPTSRGFNWAKLTPSLLVELSPIFGLLPSLHSVSVSNELRSLLPGDVDLDILFQYLLPGSLQQLEIIGFTCTLPCSISERLTTLVVEDAVVTIEGTPHCLSSLVYVNLDSASLGRLVGKNITPFPALQHFSYYSTRLDDHEAARKLLDAAAPQLESFAIRLSSHYGIRDPLPASRPLFMPTRPLKKMVFDVSAEADATTSDLSKRIKDMKDALQLWDICGVVDEIEIRLSYSDTPFIDADAGADLSNLTDWSRLEDTIVVFFPPETLKKFTIHLIYASLIDPTQSLEAIEKNRGRTVEYLSGVFAPLNDQGILVDIEFDIAA